MIKIKLTVTSPKGEAQQGIYGHHTLSECLDSALMCMELNFSLPTQFLRSGVCPGFDPELVEKERPLWKVEYHQIN